MRRESVITAKQRVVLLARPDAAATIARIASAVPTGSLAVELVALAVLSARASAERLAAGAGA